MNGEVGPEGRKPIKTGKTYRHNNNSNKSNRKIECRHVVSVEQKGKEKKRKSRKLLER